MLESIQGYARSTFVMYTEAISVELVNVSGIQDLKEQKVEEFPRES